MTLTLVHWRQFSTLHLGALLPSTGGLWTSILPVGPGTSHVKLKNYCPGPSWMRIALSIHSPSPSHLSAYSTQECWLLEHAHFLVMESMQPSHTDWQRKHNEYNTIVLSWMLLNKICMLSYSLLPLYGSVSF